MVKLAFFAIALALTGCAALNMVWYKPGATQEQFAQDRFDCMSRSQMQVSASNVSGRGSTYYGGGNVTCNTFGVTTNCSGGGGYSQPGYVSGSSASYVTTNVPLFQACMEARGWAWTSQAQVDSENQSSYEETSPTEEAPPAEQVSSNDTTTESDVGTSKACRKLEHLNKGYAAGTVTQQQFDAQFQALMKACDGTP